VGNTLLLELASSPGRIVGDARGRWGVGEVPEGEGTAVELAASLHVFGATAGTAKAAAEAAALLGLAAAPKAPVALLVESAAGSPGVIQLLGGGGGDGNGDLNRHHTDNAIVLSSRQQGTGVVRGHLLPVGRHASHGVAYSGRALFTSEGLVVLHANVFGPLVLQWAKALYQ